MVKRLGDVRMSTSVVTVVKVVPMWHVSHSKSDKIGIQFQTPALCPWRYSGTDLLLVARSQACLLSRLVLSHIAYEWPQGPSNPRLLLGNS
ncbi:hypothetical protein NPIL_53091 [Nephila pilipes]|uniref:Uncharacterized protein n=1 Tax=Nephila pilipes TaxID=299642 RepID=A0A8X6US69_NEPPI|nr:hypothetical protein NPIL_53091 [Nephila pilipes]